MANAILEKASSPSGSPRDKLYEIMSQKPTSHIFFQHDLSAMGVVEDVQTLTKLIQGLASAQLVQILMQEGEVCYRVRTREEAARLHALTADEHVIYNHIAESRTNGCWIKSLKAKTNLHIANLSKVIRSLEAKRLIKTIKNVKFPTRKIYMLSDLSPGEDVTGGAWYTDGELDIDLVEALADLVIKYVKERSWGFAMRKRSRREGNDQAGPPKPVNSPMRTTVRNGTTKKPAKQHKPNKQAASGPSNSTQQLFKSNQNAPNDDNHCSDKPIPTASIVSEHYDHPLYPPHPDLHPIPPSRFHRTLSSTSTHAAHYYPTTSDICVHIRNSGVTSLSFNEPEFQDLLDMLVWDGRLEKMGVNRYRCTRGAFALMEREREQGRRRKESTKAAGGENPDIEDLGTAASGYSKKRKRVKGDVDDDDEDNDDVVLGGRDWRKFNRLQFKHIAKANGQDHKSKAQSPSKNRKSDAEAAPAINSPQEPEFGGLTNGFAEAPCARCPVFSICSEDGPVSAASCVYFQDWLNGGTKEFEGLERRFQHSEPLREWHPA
ncbi:MAG: 34-kDa subunit of RNA polymerase III (C) [Bathelium mastoideum]|nr:MAG: 34-kDa subunit of RNA polymerase III (C) [Bathelium mastoideum]KAI9692615.1 MAG: 34-kDa subunit of RNA polymerase III (C) [Bathelium mastoideum]